jgi:hypothetical protein
MLILIIESVAELIDNFLKALRITKLLPKRFLLQTGAKHYGFHMGPAANPSFETDDRVTLEANFYYPQEDLLFAYCKEVGAKWNVVRPSYIIGAVRDNLLKSYGWTIHLRRNSSLSDEAPSLSW